jgi:cell division protein FtsW
MLTIARTNTTLVGRWWWTVDRLILVAVVLLMALGVFLVLAASTAVADQHSWSSFYFVKKHLLFLAPAICAMIGVSLLSPKQLRHFSLVLFLGSIVALIATLFIGVEIKGARRWLDFSIISIQPSEFIKPAFAIMSAWFFARQHDEDQFPGQWASMAMYALVVFLLLLQPDLGMVLVISALWMTQFFLPGLPIIWISAAGIAGVCGAVGAYFIFPHVHRRVDQFLTPDSGDRFGDRYQVSQSQEAFMNGGFFGVGPGEGTVKKYLPDAHADFIFAVAGEEFGMILCLAILAIFTFIVLRSFSRILAEQNLFVVLAVAGLTVQFGIQALINMGSTLNLMPTKGMTLPFISYGGSSLLALALGMGMVLALTRRRVGET